MADQVRVVSGDPGGRAPRPARVIVLVGAAMAVAALAFVAGRTTAPTGHTRSPVGPRPAVEGPPEPSHLVDGVGVGWPHTQAGAVAALFADNATLGNPRVLLNPGRRTQVLSLVATARYAATFAGAGARALAQARNTPLGRGLESGAQTVYLSVPIAYRVVSYTADSIKIFAYGVSVIGNDQGLQPRATWATTITTAVWQDSDWRVDTASSADGPAPASSAAPTDAVTLLYALSGTQVVRDEP